MSIKFFKKRSINRQIDMMPSSIFQNPSKKKPATLLNNDARNHLTACKTAINQSLSYLNEAPLNHFESLQNTANEIKIFGTVLEAFNSGILKNTNKLKTQLGRIEYILKDNEAQLNNPKNPATLTTIEKQYCNMSAEAKNQLARLRGELEAIVFTATGLIAAANAQSPSPDLAKPRPYNGF